MHSLETLELSHNNLKSLPKTLINMPRINELYIRFNPLTVSMVPTYKNLLQKGVHIYDGNVDPPEDF